MSSYVLDRELLLTSARNSASAAATNWIDVNSNAGLVGTTVYQRNTDCEIRRQMADVNKRIFFLFKKSQLKKLFSKFSSKISLKCYAVMWRKKTN